MLQLVLAIVAMDGRLAVSAADNAASNGYSASGHGGVVTVDDVRALEALVDANAGAAPVQALIRSKRGWHNFAFERRSAERIEDGRTIQITQLKNPLAREIGNRFQYTPEVRPTALAAIEELARHEPEVLREAPGHGYIGAIGLTYPESWFVKTRKKPCECSGGGPVAWRACEEPGNARDFAKMDEILRPLLFAPAIIKDDDDLDVTRRMRERNLQTLRKILAAEEIAKGPPGLQQTAP